MYVRRDIMIRTKRTIALLLCFVLILSAVITLVACNKKNNDNTPEENKAYTFNDYVSDMPAERWTAIQDTMMASTYRDYAETCDVNSSYPQLAHLGLKLVVGHGDNPTDKSHNDWTDTKEVDADDETALRNNFDPTKPILILTHGIQIAEGRYIHAMMSSECRPAEIAAGIDENPSPYFAQAVGDYAGRIDLSKYYTDNGYNVFYFHYENFADSLSDDGFGMAAVSVVTNLIWSNVNCKAVIKQGDQYVEISDGLTGQFSIAEYYVAEYIRAMNKICEIYPDYANAKKQIWSAAHSMGGVVNVASNFLLTQVADAGQISKNLLPCRLIQMDPYVGAGDPVISWTQKHAINNSACDAYATALEILSYKYDIATYLVCNDGFAVPCMFAFALWSDEDNCFTEPSGEISTEISDFSTCINRILAVAPFVVAKAYYPATLGESPMAGTVCHNGMREYALASIFYDAPTATMDGKTYTVPTVKMSDAEIKSLRGYIFFQTHYEYDENGQVVMDDGKPVDSIALDETIRCDDDHYVMTRIAKTFRRG